MDHQRQRLETLLHEAERVGQVGSFDHDPATGEVTWSDGLYALVGLKPGTPPLTIEESLQQVDREFRDEVRAAVTRVTGGGQPIDRLPILVRIPTGRDRWFELSAESYATAGRLRTRGVIREATITHRAVRHHRELASFGLRVVGTPARGNLVSLTTTLLTGVLETQLTAVRTVGTDGELVIEHLTGWDNIAPSPFAEQRAPHPNTAVAIAFGSREPIRVDDYENSAQSERPILLPPSLARLGVRSSIVAPIIGAEGIHGVISAHALRPQHFDIADGRFVTAVAALVATAIERLAAEDGVRKLADARLRLIADTLAAEERTRSLVSEQIHDGPLQDLLAARQDLIEAERDGSVQLIARAREGIDRAVGELRRTVSSLHPVVLRHGGLETALKAAGRQAAQAAGLRFELAVDQNAVGIGDQLVESFARELLTNVVKHACATKVEICIARAGDTLALDVIDDGIGTDPEIVESALTGGHIGLAALLHRAEALGGTLQLLPAEPNGTAAKVRLPLPSLAASGLASADRTDRAEPER